MKHLVIRADAVRARNKKLEETVGSGYHDEDKSKVTGREHVLLAPQNTQNESLQCDEKGKYPCFPRISEHLVPFFDHNDDEQVHFVGKDAETVWSVIQGWQTAHSKVNPINFTGSERKLFHKIVPKLQIRKDEDVSVLTIRLADWNDVLMILTQANIGLSGAPFVDE